MKWAVKMLTEVRFTVEVEAPSADEAYEIADSKDWDFKRQVADKLNNDQYNVSIEDVEAAP